MRQGTKRWSRSAEKEASWRGHVSRQVAGRVSIRAYCREYGLSEPAFYAWRREIAKRDAEREGSRGVPQEGSRRVPQESPTVRVAGRSGTRSVEAGSTARPRTAQRRVGGKASSARSGGAGLIAVDIVGAAEPRSMAAPTLEIECPGGPVIRLREDVPAEVLQCVMAVCQQVRPAQAAATSGAVRSC
jgi:hypothetical protein